MAKSILSICLAFLLSLQSCQSAANANLEAEQIEARRATLFTAISKLEGRWELLEAPDPGFIEFRLTSHGTALIETMHPGTDEEMINMYTLDGDSVVMRHYCALGNQPFMRALDLVDGKLVFVPEGVQDLESPESMYMSDMTITFVSEDRVDETWRGVMDGQQVEMPVFKMQRVSR
ncbi:MAG: hypothetical protein ACI8X5_003751 [Planctomycetota bacterium]|jgi:hypothetical protein